MRLSAAFASLISLQIALVAGLLLHARIGSQASAPQLHERGELVKSLGLTDLCLFTEARYTRHPSMADRFAPFQDHPSALEHFPSGSLVTPPHMRPHERTP